jgi:hypothetical protein
MRIVISIKEICFRSSARICHKHNIGSIRMLATLKRGKGFSRNRNIKMKVRKAVAVVFMLLFLVSHSNASIFSFFNSLAKDENIDR